MDKRLTLLLLCVFIISLLLGLFIGAIVSMIPEDKCMRSPLSYGISQFEGGDLRITCYCSYNDVRYSPFFFNKTGVFPYGT